MFKSAVNYWLLAAGVILVAQAAVLHDLAVREIDPRVPELIKLPHEYGAWKAVNEQTLMPEELNFLRPDGYIFRDYVNRSNGAKMDFFVAFFKSLQNTAGPHAPKDCLPGHGWLISSSAFPRLPAPGVADGVPVNQYVMEKDGERILVVYWYQNNRHIWAEEFKAKLTLLPDLIRYRRSDVSLVRLITPIQEIGPERALANAREFTSLAFPSLVDAFRDND